MKNYYSPSTGGFYNDDVHGPREIPDPNFSGDGEGPLIPNPDTTIPLDAVEITPEEKAAVFTAQSQGQVIVAGPDGKPITVDPPPPSEDQLLGDLRATRDNRLAASDWTQFADAPLDSAKKAAWVAYRQALRDLPANTPDPAQVSWPVPPT